MPAAKGMDVRARPKPRFAETNFMDFVSAKSVIGLVFYDQNHVPERTNEERATHKSPSAAAVRGKNRLQ